MRTWQAPGAQPATASRRIRTASPKRAAWGPHRTRRWADHAALVVSLTALVLALGGTARATSYVITSSSQIKDGSVASADVKNGSLTGADVKDHSLSPKDFNGFVTGPQGLAGPKGDTGRAGPAGPASPIAYAEVKADGTVDTAHSSGLVVDANIVHNPAGSDPGTYCFKGLTGVKSAMVVANTVNGNHHATIRFDGVELELTRFR